MSTRSRWIRFGVAAAMVGLAGISACGGGDGGGDDLVDPDPDPIPGFLTVRLTTPNSNDGAIRFRLSGASLDSLSTTSGRIFTTGAGSSWSVIVAGNVSSGAVARFWVPDVDDQSRYSATLDEVAARGTYEQRSLDGYSLSVSR